MNSLGLRLRKIRDSKGISQQELADNADVAKSTVQRIENGTYNPTILLLEKLATALNEDLTNFIKK
ncbi:MAG TPA: transcriptional regulator [Bacteroidetes bacterium]|nr:transcriptional regulator [Bacteroidota bacterium]